MKTKFFKMTALYCGHTVLIHECDQGFIVAIDGDVDICDSEFKTWQDALSVAIDMIDDLGNLL